MEKIHIRLQAELKRLGIGPAEAAREAGLPDSQGLRDVLAGKKRLSAELLGALVCSGVNALYVLTGQSDARSSNSTLNAALLAQVIVGIEQVIAKSGKALSASKKAQMIVTLYRAVAANQEVDPNALDQFVAKAA